MDVRITVLCVLLALVFVGVQAQPPPGYCSGITGNRPPECTGLIGKKSLLHALLQRLLERQEEEEEKEEKEERNAPVNERHYHAQDTREYDVEQEQEIRLLDFLLANNGKRNFYKKK